MVYVHPRHRSPGQQPAQSFAPHTLPAISRTASAEGTRRSGVALILSPAHTLAASAEGTRRSGVALSLSPAVPLPAAVHNFLTRPLS